MRRRLFVAVALAAIATIAFVFGQVTAVTSIDAATNQYRASVGLPALTTWSPLQTVANRRASEITANFSHPGDWQYIFNQLPSCVTGIGENIAYYTTGFEPAGWPVSAWIASPTHRANIVGTWSWQASALVTANGRTYAVQLFAIGCESGSAPAASQPPAKAPVTQSKGASAPKAPATLSLPDTAMH